jgi:hypothetical protein
MIMPTRLLVEDERIIALDLARCLTTLGYTVLATAGSGREAIQRAVDLRPDRVLMDVGLPGGMDGLDAAAHILAQAAIPIMYLTGSPEGVIPAGPRSTEAATRPHKERRDPFEFLFPHVALAIRDENLPTRGCNTLKGRAKVPVPLDRRNSQSHGSPLCRCKNTFPGHEIEPMRWYRSFRAAGPHRRRLPRETPENPGAPPQEGFMDHGCPSRPAKRDSGGHG